MSIRYRSRISACTFFIVTLFADTPRASEDDEGAFVGDAPTLHVIWNDAYDLFPSVGFDPMREEVERIFEDNGIAVRVHRAEKWQSRDAFPQPFVNAVLVPTEATEWNLERNAMAVAIGEHGKGRSIFIFHPGVTRALGPDKDRLSPRLLAELARGMGRVVAHELVHVFAPECRHAREGLMAEKLTRKALVGDTIVLDAESRRAVRAAVEALLGSSERILG